MSDSDRLTHGEWSDAVEDGDLLGQECPDCGKVQGTPKAACPDCGSTDLETVELPSEGTVYTETTIHVPPAPIKERGYQVVVVQLGDARVMGRLTDGEVDIGDSVSVSGFVEDHEGYVAPTFAAE
jgi:uncharacterized OB-fold protein